MLSSADSMSASPTFLCLFLRACVQACAMCCPAFIHVDPGCNVTCARLLFVSVLQAGLEPTHQVVRLARDAGFGNVHDYLVHLVTGRSSDCEQASAAVCVWIGREL
jgi:hypothetical protein